MNQIKNRTFHNPPRAGDGTLHENHLEPDANWFGKSQAPQEEYIDDGLDGTRSRGQQTGDRTTSRTTGSERRSESMDAADLNPAPRTYPTPSTPAPESPVEAGRTSNRQQDTQEPLSPPEVFPYGDPGQQTDG